jgi:hypothetical protein
MSYIQGGTCPHCGAAIWYPAAWWNIMPPPPTYSCSCRLATAEYVPNVRRESVTAPTTLVWLMTTSGTNRKVKGQ